MRLMSFVQDGEARCGAVLGEEVLDLTARLGAALEDLLRADSLNEVRRALDAPGPRRPLAGIAPLMPIPAPRRVFCVGANYPKRHPLGGEVAGPPYPALFQKHAEALVPHGAPLAMPAASTQLDYEGELAVIIGRGGACIREAEALRHVAGYAPFNDGSVRDLQKQSLWAGKNSVRSGAFGPWITTADEVPDPAALRLVTRLNGTVVQDTLAGRMFFGVPALIAYISAITPLLPGDVIATGSPEGSGATQDPPRWLRPGDRVAVEIGGLGTLENVVAA
ncbi:MAG TPA: fumarylacetoacetate hydrolase family protein [Crenalkalicoccus sp.]|jgi:2-keto-4-pentenoate hydratase/2-oxohepta-3-ene-1,7-dioic acid hydratase in catechol pathway|nr:fumarylacetoacetate hydrolase family protein [Crenalkalicoccus sp.]